MRPDEEMLAGVEEVELEPCDLFTYLGTLIIEGRVPGLSDRGYGEGPHCPPLSGQNRHVCDSSSSECQRQEQLEKHMLLLWKNGIPLSVEVLLYPECCQNSQGSKGVQVETSSAPQTGPCLLLEQWTLHMLHRRLADASIPPRGLIQAVRSFLHFSQLSAWLSLSKGKSNLNIHYRLCVPGEAFSSKFDQEPNYHSFPVANVGRSAMKILVKSLPRCGSTIPQVPCIKHNLSAINSALQNMPSVFPSASSGLRTETESLTDILRKNVKDVLHSASTSYSDLAASGVVKSSPSMEPSLGDSLLDPPQSLQMYPKRYQSPSRCGSPSLEAPEHLMFRPGPSSRRESESRTRLNPSTRDRSRPQRRPVVERFLKKEYGGPNANSPSLPCDRFVTHDIKKSPLEEKVGNSHEQGLKNALLYPSYKMSLPEDEMQMVLNQLRHRYPTSSKVVPEEPKEVEDNYLLKNIWLKQETLKQESLKRMNEKGALNLRNVPAHKMKAMCLKSYSEFPSNLQDSESMLHKPFHEPSTHQPSCSSPSFTSPLFSTFFCTHSKSNDCHPTSSKMPESQSLENHSPSNISDSSDQSEKALLSILNKGCHDPPSLSDLDSQNDSVCEDQTGHTCSTSSINGLLPEHRTKGDSNDRSLENQNSSLGKSTTQTDKFLTGRCHPVLNDAESLDKNVAIPSSADKLKFRRSLDSATSMVFHQNTGLPLTSSPAPIRKSGTCFDFDSSLTSVSAIKKALFEKDPENDKSMSSKPLLSTSAPSSTTTNNLLGNFEESVLNGRLEPVNTVEGFTAEIGASGSFCPRHRTLPVTVFFYTLHDIHKVTSPYLGHINLGHKGYYVPKKGTVQVTLFNPHRTVVKMFVVRYDLSDMPPNCQTFLRQRTLYMPTDAQEDDVDARKWLRYLIHLRFASSKSGKVYLHTDVRMIVFRKSDLDAATVHGQRPYELRSFTQEPLNPKFSPYK